MAAPLLATHVTPAHPSSPTSSSNSSTLPSAIPLADGASFVTEQQLSAAMRQSQYRQLCGIQCRVDHGVATLRGHVDSYYLKQMAQERAARVGNLLRVVNLIEVADC